jgi:hypothetical protein
MAGKHIHIHLTHDAGTSEGARKAAQTRKAHGGGAGGGARTFTMFSGPREAQTYHQGYATKHQEAAKNAAKSGKHEEMVAHNKAGAAHMNASRYWNREHGDINEGRRLTAEAEKHSKALGVR